MQLTGVRAISFDLDDTLWSFQACVERAESALFAWLRLNAPGTCAVLRSPTSLRSYRAQAELDHPDLLADLSGLRRASIRTILEASGEDPRLAETAFDIFFAERLRVDLYPDVLPALARLSQQFPLVALSNGNGCVHKAGVGHFFRASLSAASLGVAKPDRVAFHAAARTAGVKTSELLHVGDDLQLDVLGALNAGAQAVWMLRDERHTVEGFESAPASYKTLKNLTELCVVSH